jgi:hypothetical protein
MDVIRQQLWVCRNVSRPGWQRISAAISKAATDGGIIRKTGVGHIVPKNTVPHRKLISACPGRCSTGCPTADSSGVRGSKPVGTGIKIDWTFFLPRRRLAAWF